MSNRRKATDSAEYPRSGGQRLLCIEAERRHDGISILPRGGRQLFGAEEEGDLPPSSLLDWESRCGPFPGSVAIPTRILAPHFPQQAGFRLDSPQMLDPSPVGGVDWCQLLRHR